MQGQLKYVSSNEKGCNPFDDDFQAADNFIALVLRGGEPLYTVFEKL